MNMRYPGMFAEHASLVAAKLSSA